MVYLWVPIFTETTVKTTIEMPDELFRKAKAVAALRGQSMKQWITDLLRREIGDTPMSGEPKERKAAADRVAREIETLAAQVGKRWLGPQDAVAAVRAQRRG